MTKIIGITVGTPTSPTAIAEKLSPELQTALDSALEQAKEGGEFDGKDGRDGKDGKDGYTPIKGVDYFDGIDGKDGKNGVDGYTPVKGRDYFDGEDGKDGTSVTVTRVQTSTSDGGSNVVTFSDGKTLTVKNGSKGSAGSNGTNGKDGYTPVKGVDYFDGKDGQDGRDGSSVTVTDIQESIADGGSNVVTFSDGRVLTIRNGSKGSTGDTGAKGDKGDTGETGAAGKDGADGKTPVKGTDYYTAADKAEMVNAVLAALPTWTGGSY